MLTHHSHLLYTCMCMLSHLSCVRLYATLWIAHQSSLSMGFSGQEYWSGIPCPPPGDLPELGIEPRSPFPALAGRFFTTSATWYILIIHSKASC